MPGIRLGGEIDIAEGPRCGANARLAFPQLDLIFTGMVLVYWQVGMRVRREILQEERVEYGAQIVSALARQLTWTHLKALIYLIDPLKRKFYTEIGRIEKWNTRTLMKKIQSMLFERTGLSKTSEKLIEQELSELGEKDKITPDLVFRDPYFLDFTGLKDTCAEKDLKAASLRESNPKHLTIPTFLFQ